MKNTLIFFVLTILIGCENQSELEFENASNESYFINDKSIVNDEFKSRKMAKVDLEAIKVKNGRLIFKDIAHFCNTLKAISIDSSINFESKYLNFTSYHSISSNVLELLENVESKAEYEKIISENLVILDIVDDEVKLKNLSDCETKLLDKNLQVFIGKALYQFESDRQFINVEGNIDKIKSEKESFSYNRAIMPPKKAKVSTYCYPGVEKVVKNSDDDRKSTLNVQALNIIFMSYYNGPNNPVTHTIWPTVRIHTEAEKKVFFLGWRAYSTPQILEIYFDITFTNNENNISTYVSQNGTTQTYSTSGHSYDVLGSTFYGVLNPNSITGLLHLPGTGSHKMTNTGIINTMSCY
ncbi:hypothetical protein EGI22_02355 [Lacihabitans sp. LS3-19]|uniref:hypothetical protein n=1 Tax=Lacihabitans sp. LS3-19 TaxID=2487335 RepID=UPI0020CE6A3D|nr:hypothetical protein [Lacihabitans sp. LS3-19]MCP9766733.1 hypothetical protein [Lacihabitans sp. LS3-19]